MRNWGWIKECFLRQIALGWNRGKKCGVVREGSEEEVFNQEVAGTQTGVSDRLPAHFNCINMFPVSDLCVYFPKCFNKHIRHHLPNFCNHQSVILKYLFKSVQYSCNFFTILQFVLLCFIVTVRGIFITLNFSSCNLGQYTSNI